MNLAGLPTVEASSRKENTHTHDTTESGIDLTIRVTSVTSRMALHKGFFHTLRSNSFCVRVLKLILDKKRRKLFQESMNEMLALVDRQYATAELQYLDQIIQCILKNLQLEDEEASLHIAHLNNTTNSMDTNSATSS